MTAEKAINRSTDFVSVEFPPKYFFSVGCAVCSGFQSVDPLLPMSDNAPEEEEEEEEKVQQGLSLFLLKASFFLASLKRERFDRYHNQ